MVTVAGTLRRGAGGGTGVVAAASLLGGFAEGVGVTGGGGGVAVLADEAGGVVELDANDEAPVGGGGGVASAADTFSWSDTFLTPAVALTSFIACNSTSELGTSPLSVTAPSFTATPMFAALVVASEYSFALTSVAIASSVGPAVRLQLITNRDEINTALEIEIAFTAPPPWISWCYLFSLALAFFVQNLDWAKPKIQ
jgi:hypothetical protein